MRGKGARGGVVFGMVRVRCGESQHGVLRKLVYWLVKSC